MSDIIQRAVQRRQVSILCLFYAISCEICSLLAMDAVEDGVVVLSDLVISGHENRMFDTGKGMLDSGGRESEVN